MNKTESAYLNTLMRWLFDEEGADAEMARWALAGLAERAHHTIAAGIGRARCEQLWDERRPIPGRRVRDPWEDTAEGLAAADAAAHDVVSAATQHRAIAIAAELAGYLRDHGPESGEQHNEGELAVLADLRLMLGGRASFGGRPTLAPVDGSEA